MTASLMLTPVATECPVDGGGCWMTFHYYPEPYLFTHLVERHNMNDTTAHVLTAEVLFPVDPEHVTGNTCKHCSASIVIHDEAAWDEWSDVDTQPDDEDGSGITCPDGPGYRHEPIGA